MPVDLSMVGLQGQQAYADRMQTLANAQNLQASAEETQLKNTETERMNALQQEFSTRMRDRAAGKRNPADSPLSDEAENVQSLAEVSTAFGQFLSERGFPGKGAEYLKDASAIRKQEQEIESAEITDNTHRLENIIKVADITSRFVGTARSQEEYTAGLDKVESLGIVDPREIAKLRARPWSPDVSASLNESAIEAKDRATLDLNAQTQESLDTNRRRLAANAERRTVIARDAQRAATIARETAEKTRGAKALEVQPGDVTMAQHALPADAPEEVADYIAGQARKLVARDKTGTLTMPEAIKRAVSQAKMDGAIIPGKEVDWGFDTETTYNIEPGSNENLAIPLPRDPSKIEAGKYYITPQGIILAK